MYRRGIAAFIVEHDIALPSEECGAVVVESALAALQRLAAHSPQPLRRHRSGRYRLERQDHSQGVDRFGHAPQCQIRRLARMSYNSQLGVALSLPDDRGRRAGRLHRGGHIASGRNGAFGENDTPADNSVHVDRRRPLVELYRPPAADRREARPCARLADHNISRTLRGIWPGASPRPIPTAAS